MNKTIDVLVAGGGAAGLATGLALARAGLTVTIAGMPETIRDDARSAALFASSFTVLDRIGAGDRLRAKGWPLRAIRIVDVTGALVRSPTDHIERITHEDGLSRVDELRVGGQTQRIEVQPKTGAPAYQIGTRQGPADQGAAQGSGSAGRSSWRLLRF